MPLWIKLSPFRDNSRVKSLFRLRPNRRFSGVGKNVGEKNRLWYRRTFTVPEAWKDKTILLHFGAVDWDCDVLVNGTLLGNHQGGYDPFWFDSTGALNATGPQELVVSVLGSHE